MCGRYELHHNPDVMALMFELGMEPDWLPRYNIAPSQQAPIVRVDRGGMRKASMTRWGLIPHWAKDKSIAYKTINARAETIATTPAYRDAFKKHRCLVPASGFYEWQVRGSGKQPYRIGMIDDAPFAFAGLWSRWNDPEGQTIDTYTIVTTEPNALTAKVHSRMPVILAREDYARWLDYEIPDAQALLRPYPADEMRAYPVSSRVGSPKNDAPELIEPINDPAGTP